MSGTRHSARIEDLRKIFSQKGWDKEYEIDGNEPYNKGCDIYNISEVKHGGLPYMTQHFDKNEDLLNTMIRDHKTYHPGKQWPRDKDGIFKDEFSEFIQPHRILFEATVRKLEDVFNSFNNFTRIIPVHFDKKDIEQQIQNYKNKLKK